jgi:hypothetical protein
MKIDQSSAEVMTLGSSASTRPRRTFLHVGWWFEGADEGQGAAGAFGPPAHCKPDTPTRLRVRLQPWASQSRWSFESA